MFLLKKLISSNEDKRMQSIDLIETKHMHTKQATI